MYTRMSSNGDPAVAPEPLGGDGTRKPVQFISLARIRPKTAELTRDGFAHALSDRSIRQRKAFSQLHDRCEPVPHILTRRRVIAVVARTHAELETVRARKVGYLEHRFERCYAQGLISGVGRPKEPSNDLQARLKWRVGARQHNVEERLKNLRRIATRPIIAWQSCELHQ